jgi:hypothetical protein
MNNNLYSKKYVLKYLKKFEYNLRETVENDELTSCRKCPLSSINITQCFEGLENTTCTNRFIKIMQCCTTKKYLSKGYSCGEFIKELLEIAKKAYGVTLNNE